MEATPNDRIREGYAMGRHAADRPAPDSPGPNDWGNTAAPRLPLHADLFVPTPGSAAARAGGERATTAFERLVEPHRSALRAYVLRLTEGDIAAADSVVKETLYRAAQEPARYPQRPTAVRPWLVLTARNVLRDGERYAPAGHDDRPDSSRGPEERSPEPAAPLPATTIVAAMEELSSLHRELLVELFYGGVSLEDAATDRGVPVETVKSRLYFAMRALRIVLDQQVADRHGG
jgi:RNA polymerase sigma-70 factor (ECF subfamily)